MKQWVFPEGGKTTVDSYSPTPSPLRLQHITFIGLEHSLTVKRLGQILLIPLMKNAAKLGRLPQHLCRHTHSPGIRPLAVLPSVPLLMLKN